MHKKRVVVTGMGLVSCFGNEVEPFWQALLAGKSGVKPITSFPCEDFPTRFAASIENFDPGEYIEKKQARRIDKFIAYTIVAGKKALESAKIPLEPDSKIDRTRAGVIVGSGIGGLALFQDGVHVLRDKGVKRMNPFFIPFVISNMAGALLAMDCGFMGPNYSVATACATANYGIVSAAEMIRRGETDVMICGGVEAPINSIGVAGFCACRALSERNDAPEKASRPWDRARDGFVMGEGAGLLVLESLEHALARGAPIYGEYLGGAFTCDAYHMTEPRGDGLGVALCIEKALADAGVMAEEVNYINAHATSTPLGDTAEINALKKVFKEPGKIFMNGTKSMIGHAIGAAGGLEAIATLKSLETGLLHPTINLEDPEPDLGFIISDRVEKGDIRVAISNSFGFGGHNATVVLGRYKP